MTQQVLEIELENAVRSALLKMGMNAIRNAEFFGLNESAYARRKAA